MITAKEALQKTKDVHLKAIEAVIEAHIEKGEFECKIVPKDLFISEENIEILKENGFNVNNLQTFSGNIVTINWENA